jgi:hypothetical protein
MNGDEIKKIVDEGAKERQRMMKVIEKNAKTAPALETAEKLHERLTRAFAALHKIAKLPCQTRPEEAAEEKARRGYRQPCKDNKCAPCVAFRALIVEARLPF